MFWSGEKTQKCMTGDFKQEEQKFLAKAEQAKVKTLMEITQLGEKLTQQGIQENLNTAEGNLNSLGSTDKEME